MTYYFARTFEDGFDAVVDRIREALKQEGFGVITEIDVQATLKFQDRRGLQALPYPGCLQSGDGP